MVPSLSIDDNWFGQSVMGYSKQSVRNGSGLVQLILHSAGHLPQFQSWGKAQTTTCVVTPAAGTISFSIFF